MTVVIDGLSVLAPARQSVAELLLGADLAARVHVKGGWRAPFCMMGVCFECLVTIGGVQNRQGCVVTVAEGMDIRRQVTHG